MAPFNCAKFLTLGDSPTLHARDARCYCDNLSSAVRQWHRWLNTLSSFEYLDVTSIERCSVHFYRNLSGVGLGSGWLKRLNRANPLMGVPIS